MKETAVNDNWLFLFINQVRIERRWIDGQAKKIQ